jgi:putative membrane protein
MGGTRGGSPPRYRGGKEWVKMFGWEGSGFEFWWIFPLVMIILCFFMMRGCMGFGDGSAGRHRRDFSGSAREILDKRYARGEIDKREYEEKKDAIIQTNG